MRKPRRLSVRRMMFCPSFTSSKLRNMEYFACVEPEPPLSDCADCPINDKKPTKNPIYNFCINENGEEDVQPGKD